VAGLSLRTDRPRGGAFSSNSSTQTTRPGPWPRRRAGQEERNADHLLEAGAAIRGNNLPALAWKIDQLLDDPARLAAMRANARGLGRPQAARDIAAALVGADSGS
jgi:UDP-N-acetylglucosamine:LPS N-acetylglucosamine transferase